MKGVASKLMGDDVSRGAFRVHAVALVSLSLVFVLFGLLRYAYYPGLYMDGVNPDYLASQTLNPGLHNPKWVIPTVLGPVLGNLYHGTENYYVDLIAFSLFGQSVSIVRIAQGLFGLGIVSLIYLISWKKSGNRNQSFLIAMAMATNVAFYISFRTQFYITIAGSFWLLLSVYFLIREDRKRWHELTSGIAFGLAIYAYFVFVFFLPVLLAYVWAIRNKVPLRWGVGVAIGLSLYALGYASVILAIGGFANGYQWFLSTFHSLAPISGHSTFWVDVRYALNCTQLAFSNGGNENMIFNRQITPFLGNIQVLIDVIALAVSVFLCRKSKAFLLCLLPLSFILLASLFGKRLWVHHYVVLVPVVYMLIGITDWSMLGLKGRAKKYGAAGVFCFLLSINVAQSHVFFNELVNSGGVKYFSSAINTFSLDAMTSKDALYVFPDWGFYMPFDLLTYNSVPYTLGSDANQIKISMNGRKEVHLAYWDEGDTVKYTNILQLTGVVNIHRKTFYQRNGFPAFYVLVGDIKK